MTSIIKLFGLIILIMGISLLIHPEWLFTYLENNKDSLRIYVSGIAIRFVLGIFLIKSADESKFPGATKILGFLFIIAALMITVMLIYFGFESFQEFLFSLIAILKPFTPVIGAVSIALGSFLIYAFSSKE